MNLCAIVPIKNFAQAKLRLRDVLDDRQCAALAQAMVEDVLAAVAAATSVQACMLVGAADARRLAREYALGYCDDNDCQGLSAAVQLAATKAAGSGADGVLVLPGDLPGLRGKDIDELVSLHNGGLSLCAAGSDGGTNALLLTPADRMSFHYGPDSAAQHLSAGIDAGLDVQRVSLPAFSRDIDSPRELEDLRAMQPGPATRRWLAELSPAQPHLKAAGAC